MYRHQQTLSRMNKRIEELKQNFKIFLEHFNNHYLFSGPSLYFHRKVIKILSQKGLREAIKDDSFLEYIYATLASWGLHRMGKTNTKLVDFEEFKNSILENKDKILKLENIRITQINTNIEGTNHIMESINELINNLKISKAKTKLIFNSKTLHHLLPNLIPPIDKQYTLSFFYNSKSPSHIENCFSEIYPKFIEIANCCKDIIIEMTKEGKGFNTSETKVIDNAIIGYVLKNSKKQKKK